MEKNLWKNLYKSVILINITFSSIILVMISFLLKVANYNYNLGLKCWKKIAPPPQVNVVGKNSCHWLSWYLQHWTGARGKFPRQYVHGCSLQNAEKQLIHWSSVIPTFLLAVQQVFAQVSLGREGHVAEATLCNGLLLVFVIATHFTDVFLEVRKSSKQTAALLTLERSQVIMAGSDMHGDCGVVPERHATPTQEKRLKTTLMSIHPR